MSDFNLDFMDSPSLSPSPSPLDLDVELEGLRTYVPSAVPCYDNLVREALETSLKSQSMVLTEIHKEQMNLHTEKCRFETTLHRTRTDMMRDVEVLTKKQEALEKGMLVLAQEKEEFRQEKLAFEREKLHGKRKRVEGEGVVVPSPADRSTRSRLAPRDDITRSHGLISESELLDMCETKDEIVRTASEIYREVLDQNGLVPSTDWNILKCFIYDVTRFSYPGTHDSREACLCAVDEFIVDFKMMSKKNDGAYRSRMLAIYRKTKDNFCK